MNIDFSNDDIKEVYELQKIFLITLIDIIGSKDYDTGENIRRTAEYIKILANELLEEGIYSDIIDERYIKNLVLAAPLHDIGKINTPDNILNKVGKLSDSEFQTMQDHTVVGGYIIQRIIDKLPENSKFLDVLKMAHDIALYHHEKWNGKGYPDGLSEYEIPLSARLMAVADVFDALTSNRSYKKAFSFDESYNIILKESGKHFDPLNIKVFSKENTREKIRVLSAKNNM